MRNDGIPSPAGLKAHEERDLFRLFVGCAGLNIPEASIESRRTPEPDILCLLDGNPCAFELGGLSDQDFREGVRIATATQRMLDALPLTLPPDTKAALLGTYGQHHVNIAFSESARLRVRKPAAAVLLEWLAQRDPPQKLLVRADLPLAARNAIASVEVLPTASCLMLHLVYATHVATPDLRILNKKLSATYKTKHRIELLLHAEFNLLPRDTWIGRYGQLIRDKIEGSQFRRVWVFNPAERFIEPFEVWFTHENTAWRPKKR